MAETLDEVSRLADRDFRQRELVPPEKIKACRATVIGVGAIGRQVALQLAAIGIPWLQLVDHDTVDIVNLATQGYYESDLGTAKVEALGKVVHQCNEGVELSPVNERFKRSSKDYGNVIFCCVDSIETRKLVWETVRYTTDFYCDGRMSAEVLRVITAHNRDPASREHYPSTLFAASEAFTGGCTAKSTIYCANIAAGMMVGQFAKWLRGMPVDRDLTLNLLSAELSVA